jgi:hypothetical protein
MRAFRAFIKHLLSTAPNTPPPKTSNWFDWPTFGTAKAQTPTTKVEPGPATEPSSSKDKSANSAAEPLPNPWARKGAAPPADANGASGS